jgi:flagellar hook-basal body complex protein FliE
MMIAVVQSFRTRIWIAAALIVAIVGSACGQGNQNQETPGANAPTAANANQVAFTEGDLDKFASGLRAEIDAVKAAQKRAASATTAQERGDAMQAQWETATVPLGVEASGLSDERYRDVRSGVDRVFTTLDFQGKIEGPLSIDLDRADPQTKARVSGDAFAELTREAATALRARMERLVPLWSEYKALVAVAG